VATWSKNLDNSIRFYRDYLGYADPVFMRRTDGAITVAWFKINDLQGLAVLPLATRTAPTSARLPIDHVAFVSDDAKAMRNYMAAAGIKSPGGKALPPVPIITQLGEPWFMTVDPDDVAVEFIQYVADGWTQKNLGRFLPSVGKSQRMTHVVLGVQSISRSVQHYRDVLGFAEVSREPDRVVMRVPDGTDWIELSATDPNRAGRINYICLEMPDLAAVVAALQARTCPPGALAPTPIEPGQGGRSMSICFDPDGTRIELTQTGPD
jgi:catechol 2,3-dioxygenase-like lactoylglutathione lyase family enzyme